MEPEDSDAVLFGTTVSDIQDDDVVISNGAITGTLKYLSSGDIAGNWGAGNFMALKFEPEEGATSVKVGLDPSQGSGFVELDEDLNGVFKITDKDAQKFVVEATDGTHTSRFEYDLSGLTCETSNP